MWGWLIVVAIVASPVVLLAWGLFPAFTLLAAAVLGVYKMQRIGRSPVDSTCA